MKDVIKGWLIGLFVALLLLFPHLRLYTSVGNRYHAFWGMVDALAFITIVFVMGTFLFAAHWLVKRYGAGWIKRAADASFILLGGYAAVACLVTSPTPARWAHWSTVCTALTVLVTVLGGVTLLSKRDVIVRFLRAVCLILSPAVFVVFAHLLTLPDVSIPAEHWPPSNAIASTTDVATEAQPAPIFLFVMDEWSSTRTIDSSDMAVEFPHLRALLQTSTVFHDAHSPHRSTIQSLPRLLCQTPDTYLHLDGQIGFDDRQLGYVPARRRPNLFTGMDEFGYRTGLVGWYHPYRLMFGDELDLCIARPSHIGSGDRADFAAALRRHTLWGLSRSLASVPKPNALQWRLMRELGLGTLKHRLATTAEIHALALSFARRRDEAWFAVFHYPVPHWPFVYNREGYDPSVSWDKPLFFGSDEAGESYPDEENYVSRYVNNLRYTDTLLGELTGAMKSAGTFDDALLIFTSDHNWRDDPALRENPPPRVFTHVPLVVKYPGQRDRVDLFEPFELTDLKTRVILPALRGGRGVFPRSGVVRWGAGPGLASSLVD